MNAGSQTGTARLQDAVAPSKLDAAWWGGGEPAAAVAEQHTTGSLPERARGNGFLSWLFRWRGDASSANSATDVNKERRASRRQARPAGQRSRANLADGAAAPRLPRPQSTPKLPRPQSTPKFAKPQPPKQQADASVAGDAAAATPQQQQAAVETRRAARAAAKQANYAERRQAWRQRIEAIKSKQAGRQAAAADAPLGPAGSGVAPGSRVFSKHVAIPVAAGAAAAARAGSTHNTPNGSPRRHEPLLDAGGEALPLLEAPPVWQGFQTAEAPVDLSSASEDQLRRFLQQAGWSADAAVALPDHDALAGAVRAARGAWEVERVICACTWPEEVLRVPRKCADPAVLKAAYRRVSMAVHPDKCSAVGASDAMSIVADCFNMLTAAAMDGRAAKAVPAFMRSGHPTRAVHTSASGANLASAAATAATGGSVHAGSSYPVPPPQQAPAPAVPTAPPVWHSRHASAESFFMEDPDCGKAAWAEFPQPQQQTQEEQLPSRTSSVGVEGAAPLAQPWPGSGSSSQGDHWNPHGQLSSEEREAAAAAAAANWEQAAGGWPPTAVRSRSSSAGSLAAAAATAAAAAASQDQGQGHLPNRGSSSSLASAGGSQHGPQPGASASASPAAADEGLRRQGSAGSMGPPSPQVCNGQPSGGSPGLPPAGPNSRGSPGQQQQPGTGGAPQPQPGSRPGSAAGAAPPRPKPSGPAGNGASGPPPKQKVRITLKVRQA